MSAYMERQDIKRYIIIIYDLMDYIIAPLVVKSRQSICLCCFSSFWRQKTCHWKMYKYGGKNTKFGTRLYYKFREKASSNVTVRLQWENNRLEKPPYRQDILLWFWHNFACTSTFNHLTRSLREQGGPCIKSMEVSQSRIERVNW